MPRRPTSPAEAIQYARRVANVYADASADLSGVVARRVKAGLDTTGVRNQLQDLDRLRREAERIVVRAQAAAGSAVAAVVDDAYAAGFRSRSMVNQRALHAITRATFSQLNQSGPAMLRWTDDVYRKVIAEATQSGLAGIGTQRAVAARALDRFAAAGVTGFTDASGARWRIESYTEMATRTSIQRAHLAGTVDRLQGQGRDLVVVSASPAGCPLCRPHEGQVYSLSGLDRQYPSLSAADGLFHPNCTHTVSAYTAGLTRDPPGTPLGAPQLYRARQRQRALERRVRESKRRVAAAEEIGDPDHLATQKTLLARRRGDLTAHLKSDPRLKAAVSRQRTQVRPTTAPPAAPLEGMAAHGDLSGAYARWLEKNGTELQRRVFERYTRTSVYERWNPYLRGQPSDVGPEDLKQIKALTDLIEQSAGLAQPVRVFRGVRDADGVFGANALRPGHVFTDKAFMSTTMDDAVRDYYRRGDGGAVVEILVPKGTRVAVAETEGQLVLPPGTRLKIVSDETVDQIVDPAGHKLLMEDARAKGWTDAELTEQLERWNIVKRSRVIKAKVVS